MEGRSTLHYSNSISFNHTTLKISQDLRARAEKKTVFITIQEKHPPRGVTLVRGGCWRISGRPLRHGVVMPKKTSRRRKNMKRRRNAVSAPSTSTRTGSVPKKNRPSRSQKRKKRQTTASTRSKTHKSHAQTPTRAPYLCWCDCVVSLALRRTWLRGANTTLGAAANTTSFKRHATLRMSRSFTKTRCGCT